MRWIHTPIDSATTDELSRQLRTSPVVAELLARNGYAEPGPADAFLRGALADLADPLLVTNLEAAARRLAVALKEQHSVAILGDYDVDGVSSSALLVGVLRRLGLSPRYYVPRRMDEGYGLTQAAIERIVGEGVPALFIALDCGTNSVAEVAHLRALGAEVIVVDHHRTKEAVSLDGLLINPHVHPTENDDAWRHLCTVGLVFKLLHGLLKLLRAEGHEEAHAIRLRDQLDLVALGTIADLVSLRGENRILARHGLQVLSTTRRLGLRALMTASGLSSTHKILPEDISYRIGPRINASGRLADAALAVDLLLAEDAGYCRKLAAQLEELNRERQDIEREITAQAEGIVEREQTTECGIVLFDENWHPGVVGIVAGRIARKYNRPAIVLGNEGQFAKGSGRGVAGVNLVELLSHCAETLESWGGHPMAVGVCVPKPQVENFRAAFTAAIKQAHGGETEEAVLELSGWLDGAQISESLMGEVERLQPFGQGNPEPTFGVRGVQLTLPPIIFKEEHFRFTVEDTTGRRHSGVAWKMADRLPPSGVPLELAVHLNWNQFNGRRTLQLELLDWRLAGR